MPSKDTKESFLYEKSFEIDEGKTVTLRVNIETILPLAQKYMTALRRARNLPQDPSIVASRDPIRQFYINSYQERGERIDENYIMDLVRDFYTNELRGIQNLAYIMAFFDVPENNSAFMEDPEPYEEQVDSISSFLDPDPVITPDINNKVERRLKQILDSIADHPDIFQYIQEIIETIAVKAEAMAAQEQFRGAKTSRKSAKRT